MGEGVSQAEGAGPVTLGPLALLFAALLICVNGAVSVWLSLGLGRKLAISSVRCVVQVTILGYILVPIFSVHRWYLVFLYAALMLVVAAAEAVSRPAYAYQGMLGHVAGSLALAVVGVTCYGLLVVVHAHPWWTAQYFIPILGMLLGAAMTGVSLGLAAVLEELTTGRDRIEQLLAYGASRLEATRAAVQRAVTLALLPTLNNMSVLGIVSIPGMMTGQILGGTDPSQAARYQIVIMFLIAATTALGTVGAIMAAVLALLDRQHRLRSERLQPRGGRAAGVASWLQAQAASGCYRVWHQLCHWAARLRVVWGQRARWSKHSWLGGAAGQRALAARQGLDYDQLSETSRLREVMFLSDDDALSNTDVQSDTEVPIDGRPLLSGAPGTTARSRPTSP